MRIIALALVLFFCGCQGFDRHVVVNPGKDEVIRVVNGDRFYFDLDENMTTGYSWDYVCDDSDVEVRIDHERADSELCGAPGKAKVLIRIHRGFDGPAIVYFRYRRPWENEPIKSFKISLFRRTGDVAFWE